MLILKKQAMMMSENREEPDDTMFAMKTSPFPTLQTTSSFSSLVFHVSQAAHELGTQDCYRRIHRVRINYSPEK